MQDINDGQLGSSDKKMQIESEPIQQNENKSTDNPLKIGEEEAKQSNNEQDLENFIEILKEHQESMVNQGNFVDAEIAKNRIAELRIQIETKMQEQLKSQHLNEKLEIEEAHVQEFNKFNKEWEDKENTFKKQAEEQQETIKQKQEELLSAETEKYSKTLPEKAKPSSELLNLRTIQDNLAKQKNYADAQKVQNRIKILEDEEAKRWEKEKNHKITVFQAKIYKKFENEQNAFEKKVSSAFEQLRKQKALELERMLQKYQNSKKDLESRHLNELKELQKKHYSPKNSQIKNSPPKTAKSMSRKP